MSICWRGEEFTFMFTEESAEDMCAKLRVLVHLWKHLPGRIWWSAAHNIQQFQDRWTHGKRTDALLVIPVHSASVCPNGLASKLSQHNTRFKLKWNRPRSDTNNWNQRLTDCPQRKHLLCVLTGKIRMTKVLFCRSQWSDTWNIKPPKCHKEGNLSLVS